MAKDDIYLPFENDPDFNWHWTFEQVDHVKFLWYDNHSVWEIAEEMNRDPDEVAILIMSLIRSKKLTYRDSGIGKKKVLS